ncbi:MAG: copper-binding protein [Polyangiaceae bacterium]|nr:copper-binding protein [Polyangiaceae bacterium]
MIRARALALSLSLATPALAATALVGCSKKAEVKTYSATGVVKGFSPDKKLVNIRHEEIPGYMSAMTMSFEVKTPSQIEGLAAGDKISFKFTDEDGRRVLAELKKQ